MQKKMILLYVKYMLVVLALCPSCKHHTDQLGFIGPEFAPAPQGFKVVNNAFSSKFAMVDFTADSQYFLAAFSTRVQWYISLQGQTSGAEKILSGISVSLDGKNSAWDGSSGNNIFFQAGEQVLASLYFLQGNIHLTSGFTIMRAKNESGILLDDFEKSLNGTYKLDSILLDANNNAVVDKNDSSLFIQGRHSLLLAGSDRNSDYWIASALTGKMKVSSVLFPSPETCTVNLFIYGRGAAPSGLEIKVMEDDDGSGTFEINKDDAFHSIIAVNWQGWKWFSIPYSEFTNAAADGVGKGNNLKQPSHLLMLGLALLSVPSGGDAKVNVDYITLSTK